ncbi:MAG: DinB family protein [Kouleothrix sp.]|nr:DinB family protein [Kouleothrix sp.]
MAEPLAPLAAFSKGWSDYQALLIKALRPLTPDQLTLRAAPHLRSVGEIATHMIGARGRWLHGLMGEGGEALAALAEWDRPGMPTRDAAELAEGLATTWQVMQAALTRWTQADLAYTFSGERRGEHYSFTRQWVIWHLIEHDLHHGGEISLTLGAHELTAIDI